MKLSSFADLQEAFRLMAEHNIDCLEFEGVRIVRTVSQLGNSNTPYVQAGDPDKEPKATSEDEREQLLDWWENGEDVDLRAPRSRN